MTYNPNIEGKTLSEAEREGCVRSPITGKVTDVWGNPVQGSIYGGKTYESSAPTISESDKR